MSRPPRLLFLGLSALAASLPPAARSATPAEGAAVVRAPAYDSAFEGYRPFQAGDVQDWRRTNDTVRAAGGWRAYAREIGRDASSPAQEQVPASPDGSSALPPGPHAPAPAGAHGSHQP